MAHMLNHYSPARHHRRSIRLRDYDYSQAGAYFVTICTRNGECLFGKIAGGEMIVNNIGNIVRDEWLRSVDLRKEIDLDGWVMMPNHIHAIVVITDLGRGDRPVAPTTRPGPRPRSLSSLIAGFKSAVTARVNESRGTPGVPVWQRNYYEHVIRNDADLARIRDYVAANPTRWDDDENNPINIRSTPP
jgi:REP element-mobilizing transposase RayT